MMLMSFKVPLGED